MRSLFRYVLMIPLVMFGQNALASLPDFRDLVKETSPAVVNISTIQHSKGNPYHQQFGLPEDVPEIFRHFFGVPQQPGNPGGGKEHTSLGSGFIVSEDGYILTNNHVIQDADEIIVRLNDRRQLNARIIGADKSSDLAVLKVDADDLPTVELGSSEKLEVGEWVVAIGSPFGFDYSVTAGIVSAKGRSLPNENYVPFIQTDVAINPGNSGGPLFNLEGEVVGINSQIYTRSGGFMGVSFAIPIDVAMEVVEQLKETGAVSRGWLGVVIQEVNKDLAESFGLDKAAGALVAQVLPDSPAKAAGFRTGDVILNFDGKEIRMSSDLPHHVGRVKPGSVVRVNIMRNGKRKVLKVTIGALDTQTGQASVRASSPGVVENERMGVVVAEQDKNTDAASEGVVVKKVLQGPASVSGVAVGDVITSIHGQTIRNLRDFERAVDELPAKRRVPMRIVRRGVAMFIPLRVE